MKLIQILFCVYIFMKQFYIFSSGGLQPADLIFIVSFILYFMQAIREGKLIINNMDKLFLLFLYLLIMINLVYSLANQSIDFLTPCMFYTYNFIVIILFRQLIKEEIFLEKLLKTLKLALAMQMIIYVLGLGRWYGGIRYMGTFNDPNQMAFYVLISFLIIVVLNDLLKNKSILLYLIMSIFLIIETSSTGMMLGLVSFIVLYFIVTTKEIINVPKFKIKSLIKFIIILSIVGIVVIYNYDDINLKFQELTIVKRIEQKISEISPEDTTENQKTVKGDRGLDKLLLYPQYMLIGAGEGNYSRFDKSYNVNEIHSTLPSILFYYGLIPTALIIIWIIKNIQYIPKHIYPVYIALIIESFTLLNQRQTTFWIIFMLGSLYMGKYINYENTLGGKYG